MVHSLYIVHLSTMLSLQTKAKRTENIETQEKTNLPTKWLTNELRHGARVPTGAVANKIIGSTYL